MQPQNQNNRESDLVLAPNSHSFILNKQKGEIDVYVGPHKANLDQQTEQPQIFDYEIKKFVDCKLSESIKNNMIAPEGWYLILKNPAKDDVHPKSGLNSKQELQIGKKINIQGPIDFALFPGQMCKVVKGHHLRTNQYLIVRVYDEDSAKEKWHDGVMKTVGEGENQQQVKAIDEKEITMGKLFVIKGTNVSFYIPPTGVEVLTDEKNNYVQEAVTLERLDYCMLLDEDGNKEYVIGPAVVFPKPTQRFIKDKNGHRKYRAITLNELSGLYINVIADYEDSTGKHKAGEELFITGKEQPIYYPKEEHAIIKYGKKMKHYAIAVPRGEGRYVMDRNTGDIKLITGPTMLLCDPRTEIIIKRVLNIKNVQCWFPGNEEALNYNVSMSVLKKDASYITDESASAYFASNMTPDSLESSLTYASPSRKSTHKNFIRETSGEGQPGDEINRGSTFSKPRAISLESSKYDGAVRINVWRGYSICVESTSKESKVIIGPATKLLEYDEDLVTMELSRSSESGAKTDDDKLLTPYLRILNNRISDRVDVVTKDMCEVTVRLSYMVNFREEDKNKWFDVENYVQFICERTRSMIQRMAKQHGVERFYQEHIDLIRDLILDKQTTTKTEQETPENKKQAPVQGRYFSENGMYISDVEISSCELSDDDIENMLDTAQAEIIGQTLMNAEQDRKLAFAQKEESTKRKIADEESRTRQNEQELEKIELGKILDIKLKMIENDNIIETAKEEQKEKMQGIYSKIAEFKRDRISLENKIEQESRTAMLEIDAKMLLEENKAFAERFKAVTPDLIQALKDMGDKNLIVETSKNLSLQSILADKNITEILQKALSGTSLGNNFDQLVTGFKALKANGGKQPKQAQ